VTPFERPVTDSVAKINDEVAVGEDLQFQRQGWRFERVVWVIFTVLIVLDLAGVFGRGPLANAAARSADDAFDVSYERIERSGTPSIMTVKIHSAADDGHVELFMSDSALSDLGLQRVIPAPERTTLGAGGLTYTFPTGALPAVVRFEFEPVGMGIYHLQVGVPRRVPVYLAVAVVP
jgi:hypothetical protein